MKKTVKIETLGEAQAVIKVKRVRQYWIAGGRVTSDDGAWKMTVPCGKGGVIEASRERAVLWIIHDFGKALGNIKGFDMAKGILRTIEDSIQPRLF